MDKMEQAIIIRPQKPDPKKKGVVRCTVPGIPGIHGI